VYSKDTLSWRAPSAPLLKEKSALCTACGNNPHRYELVSLFPHKRLFLVIFISLFINNFELAAII
jgi:hypothetical protein